MFHMDFSDKINSLPQGPGSKYLTTETAKVLTIDLNLKNSFRAHGCGPAEHQPCQVF